MTFENRIQESTPTWEREPLKIAATRDISIILISGSSRVKKRERLCNAKYFFPLELLFFSPQVNNPSLLLPSINLPGEYWQRRRYSVEVSDPFFVRRG